MINYKWNLRPLDKFINAFGEKKRENNTMIQINNLALGKNRFGAFLFRRRRFKIARSAQLPFIIYNLSFIVYNLNGLPPQAF